MPLEGKLDNEGTGNNNSQQLVYDQPSKADWQSYQTSQRTLYESPKEPTRESYGSDEEYTNAVDNYNQTTAQKYEAVIGKSAKIFGIPHQFIKMTDPRIGENSSLGRCFAEKILTEAPIVALQPGKPDFLPGMDEEKKKNFFKDVISASDGDNILRSVFNDRTLQIDNEEDMFLYYRHKSAYSEMMSKVNVLCRILACFLGIHKKEWQLPNGQKTTYGSFDWRDYTTLQTYGDVEIQDKDIQKETWWSFIANTVSNAVDDIMQDKEWIRFYVDANASYGESNSNRTTGSMLESFTEKLEGFAKELEFISGMSGIAVNDLAKSSASSVSTFMDQHRDGPIGTLLGRITGATKQIIAGGNFLIPQIWSDSEYSKNYSFSVTLTTPYGCKEAWFLNVGVPLMHLLALSLPQQVSANVYKSPYLVKCFSPGWFNCNLGIIDSINIEKGADSSWNVSGLPNEIKVSLSVTDLYATLALPEHPNANQSAFLASGMLEFLAVNCGVDITHQSWSSRMKIWATILESNIRDRFTRLDNDVVERSKRWIREKIVGII